MVAGHQPASGPGLAKDMVSFVRHDPVALSAVNPLYSAQAAGSS
jgi:hypothetical protein